MKNKSILVAIAIAVIAAIVKFQCTGTGDTAKNDVVKIINAGLNVTPEVVHDTVKVLVPQVVYKYKTDVVYKTEWYTDTAVVLQTIVDSVLVSDDGVITYEDSLNQEWGTARLKLMVQNNQPLAWSLEAEPNPCPGAVDLDSLNAMINKPIQMKWNDSNRWAFGAGLGWNVRTKGMLMNFNSGYGPFLGYLYLNDFKGVESFGLTYLKRF